MRKKRRDIMTKVSDYARYELDKLGEFYFIIFWLMFTTIVLSDSKEIIIVKLLLLMIVLFLLSVWLIDRTRIIKENKRAAKRQKAIKECYHLFVVKDLIIHDNWLDKKLTSTRFIDNEEEKKEIAGNRFSYEIILDKANSGLNPWREVKVNTDFYVIENMIKIDGIDSLAFLPDPSETEGLLTGVFGFINYEYCLLKKISRQHSDYTFKALIDVFEKTKKNIRNVLLKNYQDALKIFLSGEEFEIAGETIKGEGDKKILLITAVRTETKYIVLFPEKSILDIFSSLNKIVLKNEV
ncbi:hypothetical protein KAI65_02460 [Candidatus Parcubacteria bacterium]|nr:hypothetical protein [Candidatus Parcubacteria bacterium]